MLTVAPAAGAQSLPKPELGLWEMRMTMLIDGQDPFADARRQQAESMKKLSPEQRKQIEAAMSPLGGKDDVHRECIDAKAQKMWSDPNSLLREMEKDSPECRYQPVAVSGATLQIKGRCQDPDGFTGDVTGGFTMQGNKAWTMRYQGTGTMAGRRGRPTKPTEMRLEGSGRWVGANCGDVKPD
jgi:hypothetical protein